LTCEYDDLGSVELESDELGSVELGSESLGSSEIFNLVLAFLKKTQSIVDTRFEIAESFKYTLNTNH
jgi:hypothetical protein